MAQLAKGSYSELEGLNSWFKSHRALGQTLGLNLIKRLPVIFEWGCPLESTQKFAVGLPNNWWKITPNWITNWPTTNRALKNLTFGIWINNSSPMLKYVAYWRLGARLHETRSELKPVWNLKTCWQVVPFTWQFHCGQTWDLKPLSKIVPFTWWFHSDCPLNHSKTLLHMRKW